MSATRGKSAIEPFRSSGNDIGVLLCHGFTGSPASLRPWADRLAAEGFTVDLPLLPGHGTTWQQMNTTTFDDWLAAVTAALVELTGSCRKVVVCGLSMGGALTLRLAELHPDRVAGIVLVNPSVMGLNPALRVVPVLKYLVPSIKGVTDDIARPNTTELGYSRTPLKAVDALRKGWAVTRKDLALVRQPLLLLRSRVDHVVEPENARVILDSVSSIDVTEVVLDRSYHVATLDYDAELIFDRSVDFIRRVTQEDQ